MSEEEKIKQRDILFEKIKKACEDLYPFFDSVHIFANIHEDNKTGTVRTDYGLGNWFARYGQISLWAENSAEIDYDDCSKDE